MDAERFERVVRALTTAPSRRRVFGGVAGAIFSAAFGLDPLAVVAKGGKKKGKGGKGKGKGKKKPSPPVPPAPCAGQANDTACNGTGKCLNGVCNPRPDCVLTGVTCASAGFCCSNFCEFNVCQPGGAGKSCVGVDDCLSGSCIGYRCQPGGAGATCEVNPDCLSNQCVATVCQ